MNPHVTRRQFLAASTVAAGIAAAPMVSAQSGNTPKVCIFSKHLQFMDCVKMAERVKIIGADGVDLTVRKGGHVLPENVTSDLPKAVEAIRAAGLEASMITTDLLTSDEATANTVLKTASSLGIPYFRIGALMYSENGNPAQELPAMIEKVRKLAALAKEHNMVAGYHNHSGANYVGAALWNLHTMITAINSDSFGSNFDMGHATVEGALGAWRINARLLAPYVKMMAAKDFIWREDKPRWVPLGLGFVKAVDMLTIMRAAGFAGPISLHFEYETQNKDILFEQMAEAVNTMRAALKEASYA